MVPLAMKTRKDPKIHLVPPFPNYQNTKIPQIHGSFTMKNNNTMFCGQVWGVLPFFCWKPMSAGMPCRSYFLYIPRVQPLFSLPPVTSQSRPPPSPTGTTVMASPATPGPCNPSSTQEPEQFCMCANLSKRLPRGTTKKTGDKLENTSAKWISNKRLGSGICIKP